MKKTERVYVWGALIFSFVLLGFSGSTGETVPKAQLPVFTTAAGQDGGSMNTVNIVLEESGIPYDYCDVPDVELLKAGVGLADKESGPGFHVEVYTDTEKYPKGTQYKTVIFAIGASLKGMGASGLTVNSEVNRLTKLIDYCKKKGIFVIAVHVGGSSKRGDSDNERMIDAVAPGADYLVITSESNKDGRFTKISQEKKIPLTEVEYALNLVDIFKQVFQAQ